MCSLRAYNSSMRRMHCNVIFTVVFIGYCIFLHFFLFWDPMVGVGLIWKIWYLELKPTSFAWRTRVDSWFWFISLQVLSRLAPFERGLFEDYVANFWCGTSMLIKWKQLFSIPGLALMALGATVTAALPSMLQQIWAPSARGFLLAMLNGSFAFFFFAFQGNFSQEILSSRRPGY